MNVHLSEIMAGGPLKAARAEGAVLGPYVVEGTLGRGGMGVVYKAVHGVSGQRVALKVLHAGALAKRSQRERFIREAKVGLELVNAGAVPIHDAGEERGLLYIAFGFVDGGTLTDALEARMEALDFLELMLGVLGTLEVAHRTGIVHRDLKPDNVLVRREDGRPLLADFGLARNVDLASSLTKTGAMLGTPAYMAPEQIKGEKLTAATDVFAVGLILYEGLTGERPFVSANTVGRLAVIQTHKPPRPSASADVSRAVDAVVLRCLTPDPAKRYPDAGAVRAALSAALAQPTGGGFPLAAVAGGVLLLLGLGVGGAVAMSGGESLPVEPPVTEEPTPAPEPELEPEPEAESEPPPVEETRAGPTPEEAVLEVRAQTDPAARYAKAQEWLETFPYEPELKAVAEDLRPWTKVEAPSDAKPPRRMEGAVAWDPEGRRLFLWGGMRTKKKNERYVALRDLWSWEESSGWTKLAGGKRLAKAAWGALAYDAGRRRLVAFGGKTLDEKARFLGTTWEWDGEGWTAFPASKTGATPSAWHAMVYDPVSRRVLTYGGRNGSKYILGGPRAWDGERWTAVSVSGTKPQDRRQFGSAYDSERARWLIYGGLNSAKKDLGGFWAFRGGRWTRLHDPKATTPGKRRMAALVALPDGALLLGGDRLDNQPVDRTILWLHRDGAWTQRHPLKQAPLHRRGSVLAVYDAAKKRVLFVDQIRGEVWSYTP